MDWSTCRDALRVLMAGRKYRRLFFSVSVVFVFVFIAALAGISYFDHQHNNILHHYVAREDDIAVLSATYYQQSKSFENNTIVILFAAHQVFHLKHPELQGLALNGTGEHRLQLRIYPVIDQLPFYCKWVPYIAVATGAEHLRELRLGTKASSTPVAIRRPVASSPPVVACFSPLFLNERWQLLLMTAEVYSHYGAFMHFYIRSMITDLYTILNTYENTRVVPWPAIKIGKDRANSEGFDANVELEFRNQAGAMTDCLLLYKESAQYIIFPDTDDMIVPRLAQGDSYLQEFNYVFNVFPDAATIAYNMTQAELHSATKPNKYSLGSVLSSIRMRGEHRWGKLVVRPERVDSVWIHQSYGIREGYEQVALPIEMNAAVHLRFWNFTETDTSKPALYNPFKWTNVTQPLIPSHHLDMIRASFARNVAKNAKLYRRLPRFSIYYPLIEKCYNKIFYNGEAHSTCKGPEMCDLPAFPGVRCANVNSTWKTFTRYENVYIHQLTSASFEQTRNGCRL